MKWESNLIEEKHKSSYQCKWKAVDAQNFTLQLISFFAFIFSLNFS